MGCAVSLRLLKIKHFYALFFLWKIEHIALAVVSSYISSVFSVNFFLQLIANKKIVGVTKLPMIDLGKSKEVTAVLKL